MALRRLLIAAVAVVVFASACPQALAIDSPYTVSADYIFFNIDKKTLLCSGHVELSYGDLRIYSDTMRVDVKSDLLEAEGAVRVMTLVPRSVDESAGGKDSEGRAPGEAYTLYGDFLQYDLYYVQGMMLQTKAAVLSHYFVGTELVDSAELPELRKGEYFDDQHGEPMTSLTARKIKVSPFSKYEAWKAVMYVKGGRTMSLPYYTNDSGKFAPGNWRLRRARYSSNDNFSMGVGIRYGEKRGRKGFFSLDYRDKGSRHFVLGLDQELRLGNKIGGAVNIANLGGNDGALSLMLSRYSVGMRSHSLNVRMGAQGSRNVNYSIGDKWRDTTVRGAVSGNWSSKDGSAGTMYASLNLTPETRYLDNKKKVAANFDSGMSYNDPGYSDASVNTFVGVSVNRSGWSVGPRGTVSAGVSGGYDISTEGDNRNRMAMNVSFNRSFKAGSFVAFAYRAGSGSSGSNQTVSTSFGVRGKKKWSTSFSTNYDVRSGRFSTLSGITDLTINKKCRLMAMLGYDLEQEKFVANTFSVNYKLYASTMNLRWNKRDNDFVVDFQSQFR